MRGEGTVAQAEQRGALFPLELHVCLLKEGYKAVIPPPLSLLQCRVIPKRARLAIDSNREAKCARKAKRCIVPPRLRNCEREKGANAVFSPSLIAPTSLCVSRGGHG